MVTPPGGSRPVALEQRQVDDIVRGDHDGLARILRSTPPRAPAAPEEGSADVAARPVEVTAKEMDAIRRSGAPSKGVARRLAGAERPPDAAPPTAKGGAATKKQASGKRAGAPSVSPP